MARARSTINLETEWAFIAWAVTGLAHVQPTSCLNRPSPVPVSPWTNSRKRWNHILDIILPVKYREIVADKLSAAGWSCDYLQRRNATGRRWIVDAPSRRLPPTLSILTNC